MTSCKNIFVPVLQLQAYGHVDIAENFTKALKVEWTLQEMDEHLPLLFVE